MTIALQAQSKQLNHFLGVKKIMYSLIIPFYRLWWHVHAYTTIFVIIFLSLLSLTALYIYDRFALILHKLYCRFSY